MTFPSTKTWPESMNCAAAPRDRAKPRRTNAWSSRSRAPGVDSGAGGSAIKFRQTLGECAVRANICFQLLGKCPGQVSKGLQGPIHSVIARLRELSVLFRH